MTTNPGYLCQVVALTTRCMCCASTGLLHILDEYPRRYQPGRPCYATQIGHIIHTVHRLHTINQRPLRHPSTATSALSIARLSTTNFAQTCGIDDQHGAQDCMSDLFHECVCRIDLRSKCRSSHTVHSHSLLQPHVFTFSGVFCCDGTNMK